MWLFEQPDIRIEGKIIGFDEFTNVVLDDAVEINLKKETKKKLGMLNNSMKQNKYTV